jgi:hypothetical protein
LDIADFDLSQVGTERLGHAAEGLEAERLAGPDAGTTIRPRNAV